MTFLNHDIFKTDRPSKQRMRRETSSSSNCQISSPPPNPPATSSFSHCLKRLWLVLDRRGFGLSSKALSYGESNLSAGSALSLIGWTSADLPFALGTFSIAPYEYLFQSSWAWKHRHIVESGGGPLHNHRARIIAFLLSKQVEQGAGSQKLAKNGLPGRLSGSTP